VTSRWVPIAHCLYACVVVGAVFALSAQYDPPLDDARDASYYFQVARHVSEGEGLLTRVSLYHQGLDPLPQRSTVYPLWPWLLGKAGALMGMEQAATWVPRFFFVVDSLLLFALLSRLWRRWRPVPGSAPAWRHFSPNAAHAGLLMWAVNPMLFYCSARPYTEMLALGLTIASLWAFDVALQARLKWSPWWVLTGVLAGACYATRFQLVTVPFALGLALLLAGPKKHLTAMVLLSLGAAIPMGWVAADLAPRPGFTPAMLLEFAAFRQLPALPPFVYTIPTDGVLEKILDVLGGVWVAINPYKHNSFWASFSYWVVIPFMALIQFLGEPQQARERLKRWHEAPYLTGVASALVGLSALAPLFLTHSDHWNEWLFGWRHGLPFIFVLLPTGAWLAASPWAGARWAMLILLVAGVVTSGNKVRNAKMGSFRWHESRSEVAAWLDDQGAPTVLAIEPQQLSMLTRRAKFHWLACWSPPEVAEILLRERQIDYVIFPKKDEHCASLKSIKPRLIPHGTIRSHRSFIVMKVPHEQ
jgi:hypothetical protein